MRARVLYHDHCFDGAASSAFVTRFLQEKFYREAEFRYTGLAHRADQLFEDGYFDGDVNVIVDFKYSTNPNLTWWFDHHQSAFLSPEDAEHFRHDTSGRKMFDPSYRSCTKFIATIARDRFGFEAPDLEELVTWADIVDGALYESAQSAVEMNAPAMKLTLVIEGAKGSDIVQKIILAMQRQPLAEIVCEPEIQALYQNLHQNHLRTMDVIRQGRFLRRRCDLLRLGRTTELRATTSSFRTTCFPIPRTRCRCPRPVFEPRSRSARIRGYASRCGTIWRRSANATAAAATRK